MGRKVKVGVIRPENVKVRRKPAPPPRRHKSIKDYDRQRVKEDTRKELGDE